MTPRRAFAVVFSIVILPVAALVASCVHLTPEDHQAIAADAVRIALCQAEGMSCKEKDAGSCRAVYEDCMVRRGLKDGGRE